MSAPTRPTREIVGLFADQAAFEAALGDLKKAGFAHADLSVLASHTSIDAAGTEGQSWKDALTALVGELKYEGPLVASGAVFLIGGATAGAVAAIIAATTATVAANEFLAEVTAKPHTEAFARAVEAGSIILWIAAETDEKELLARSILQDRGAGNIHAHEPGKEDNA